MRRVLKRPYPLVHYIDSATKQCYNDYSFNRYKGVLYEIDLFALCEQHRVLHSERRHAQRGHRRYGAWRLAVCTCRIESSGTYWSCAVHQTCTWWSDWRLRPRQYRSPRFDGTRRSRIAKRPHPCRLMHHRALYESALLFCVIE